MAYPIQPGYKFKFEHKTVNNQYSMNRSESYKDSFGIGYRVTGDRLITTPGKAVVTLPGSAQFVHRDTYHRTTPLSEGICEGFNLKFREEFAQNIIATIGQENFDNLYSMIGVPLTEDAGKKALNIMQSIEYEWNNYDTYSESIIEGLVIQFFVNAVRGQAITAEPLCLLSSKHIVLMDAIKYLEQHYLEDPSLKQTAACIHTSPAHLSRLFTSELQTSYSVFLTEIKLEHAMKLLVNTNIPITEVAAQSGYQNSNYFCDAFKKHLGMSPLRFRKSKIGSTGNI